MAQSPDAPAIWLICSEGLLRARLARGLRVDGMNVVEFAAAEAAVAALQSGARPAIAVVDAAGAPAVAERIGGSGAGSPPAEIVVLGDAAEAAALPAGAHRFQGELSTWRLSRFLRLVVARPALRSALQAAYRLAHEQPLERMSG